jgi:hypothetical protein
MSIEQLIPALHALPRADKLQVIQILAADVAREEAPGLVEPDKAYPLWSPHDAFEGAATLLQVLADDRDDKAAS